MLKITHQSNVKISRFFEEGLGVKLKNHQWSYGAMDTINNCVFLKVWVSEQKEHGVFLVYKKKWTSRGSKERWKHLEAVRSGAKCFGVLCEFIDPEAEKAKIKTFDDEQLLLLGNLIEENNEIYAKFVRRIPITELADSTLVADIKSIISNQTAEPTTVQALVNARVGQGKFGLAVRQLWNHRCSVTGSSVKIALEASHIQPWRNSNDNQRLDPNNGILLTASLHKLFDAGLISFESSEKMIVSSKLSSSECEIYGLNRKKLSKIPTVETANYLLHHRTKIFLG